MKLGKKILFKSYYKKTPKSYRTFPATPYLLNIEIFLTLQIQRCKILKRNRGKNLA